MDFQYFSIENSHKGKNLHEAGFNFFKDQEPAAAALGGGMTCEPWSSSLPKY